VLIVALALQVTLGAWVVLSHVEIAAAALHQLNGALVLACCVGLLHGVRR
jgi:heme A synthase